MQPASPRARITEQIATNNFLIEFPSAKVPRFNIVIILEFMASAETPHFPQKLLGSEQQFALMEFVECPDGRVRSSPSNTKQNPRVADDQFPL